MTDHVDVDVIWINVHQVMARLGVSRRTVYYWIKRGRLVGKHVATETKHGMMLITLNSVDAIRREQCARQAKRDAAALAHEQRQRTF